MGSTTNSKEISLRMLNLGCGATFHPDWVNVDFHNHGGAVIAYDLRLGIPFADSTVDVVYHSHVLEHFTREGGKKFIDECFRVLRPGGVLRVVVPDLENITRAYLATVDAVKAGDDEALERHEWMTVELIDQLVRTEPGGEMGAFWKRNPMPQEGFILSRSGQEFVNFRQKLHQFASQPTKLTGNPLPRLNMDFLQGGELHRWMYDEVSLKGLLGGAGFVNMARQAHNSSLRQEITEYGLDAAMDGTIRKPDSLFMEAMKPEASEQPVPHPRIAIFSTADAGGAGIAALRQHVSLRAAGLPSQMYVAEQKTNTPCVYVMPSSSFVTSTGHSGAMLPGLPDARRQRANAVKTGYIHRPEGLEFFSTLESCANIGKLPFNEDFDILNLHWIADFISVDASFDALRNRPLVWTLHDMRPFTGGCHYVDGCRKFEKNCGSCPQLGSRDEQDLSFQAWRTQMTAYRKLNLHIVAPSVWLAEEARKSSLFKRFPVHVIKYAQPLDVFRPLQKETLRQSMGIGAEELVLGFSAQNLDNTRKGMQYLLKSLQQLAASPLREKLRILLLGNKPPDLFFQLGIRVNAVGHVDDTEQMALLYNAIDAVIVPSLEDNSPNVICEAAGCGVPVIAFAAGGIPEMIRHKETGWLAPVKDADSLAHGVFWLDEARKDPTLRLRCRAFALESWNPVARAREYKELFSSLKDVQKISLASTERLFRQGKGSLPERIPSILAPGAEAQLSEVLDTGVITELYLRDLKIDVSKYFVQIPLLGIYVCQRTGLLQYTPAVAGDSGFYEQLQKFDWYYLKDKHEYRMAKAHFPQDASVLEVGCGEAFFAELYSLKNYTGLEFNPHAVARSQAKGFAVFSENVEVYAKKYRERHDVVCAFQVLEHVQNPYKFIQACLMCLKNNGVLIVSTPSEDSFVGKIKNYTLNLPPHHVTRWTDASLHSIKDLFSLSSSVLQHDNLMDMHINLYKSSMSSYYASKILGYKENIIPIAAQEKIKQLGQSFLPVVERDLEVHRDTIWGHDVVSIFHK